MKLSRLYHALLTGSLLLLQISPLYGETYYYNSSDDYRFSRSQPIEVKLVPGEPSALEQTAKKLLETGVAPLLKEGFRLMPRTEGETSLIRQNIQKAGETLTAGFKGAGKQVGEAANIVGEKIRGWAENIGKPATYEERIAQLRKIAYYGLLFATIPTVGYVVQKGAEISMDVIRAELLNPKPAILNKKQKPVYGRLDRMRRWWAGSKHQEMVFDASVKDRLVEINKKTTSLRDLIQSGKDRQYANLLLYGEPGTGKTLFAQVLAEETNMDFLPVTAASLLQAGVEGIKYFDEIINMANRSKYGTIIFVDEADALFIDRTKLDPSSDHYKVLNHILSIVDGRSNKFMVVAATNHAYLLDPAMGRRFQDRVLMPLPDATTRRSLLDLYIPQILFNVKQTSATFVADAKALFTPSLLTQIAQNTEGLSHAEIADMIEAMRNKAELNKRSVTLADAQSAVNEALEKRRRSEEDKKLREQRAAAQGKAASVE